MTVWVVGLEPIEQRYTGEWDRHLPAQIRSALDRKGIAEEVRVVRGPDVGGSTTAGAFLDFAATNVFKAAQVQEISQAFQSAEVQAGDRFLFTDAWHFGVIALRYMSDLMGVPIKTIGLFHAGSYDPHDFLGRIPDTQWAMDFERSLYSALDVSCFATDFHVDMFRGGLGIADDAHVLRCGWPMEYLRDTLKPFARAPKRKLVLFPHRVAPEKQVDVFRDLAGEFPDYEFRVCQDTPLTKAEYHGLLGEAVLVFSASLQETLGIGLYEGMLCGARPFAPDRLSYSEMYPGQYLYPAEWTESWRAYVEHRTELVQRLRKDLREVASSGHAQELAQAAAVVGRNWFDGAALYDELSD